PAASFGPEAAAGAGPFGGQSVPPVVHRASVEREAAAADAALEVLLEPAQIGDPVLQALPPSLGEPPPVLAVGDAPIGQLAEGVLDLLEGQAHRAGGPDERHSAQFTAAVAALVAAGAHRVDHAERLVVADRRGGQPGTSGEVADRHQTPSAQARHVSLLTSMFTSSRLEVT